MTCCLCLLCLFSVLWRFGEQLRPCGDVFVLRAVGHPGPAALPLVEEVHHTVTAGGFGPEMEEMLWYSADFSSSTKRYFRLWVNGIFYLCVVFHSQIQFFLTMSQTMCAVIWPCSFPRRWLYFQISYMVTLIFLFSNFYIQVSWFFCF